MLNEAIAYLTHTYGEGAAAPTFVDPRSTPVTSSSANGSSTSGGGEEKITSASRPGGWEILVVSDGSTDDTVDVALRLAAVAASRSNPELLPHGGPVRVISLDHNRGKGGAVTHGMRHVRGQYVLFADADGASTFSDLSKLMDACRAVADPRGRALAIGSRAHLVGSEAVVKVSSAVTPPLLFPLSLSLSLSLASWLMYRSFGALPSGRPLRQARTDLLSDRRDPSYEISSCTASTSSYES